MGSQLVIESPESVNLVRPPIKIMSNNRKRRPNNQKWTILALYSGLYIVFMF